MKWFVFVQLLIMVVSLFGGSNVTGNVSLKKRVNTLEMRVNSIEMRVNTDNSLIRTDIAAMEQNIESLNMSLLILEDHICTPKGNAENQRHSMPGHSLSTENADDLHLSKIVLSAGLADEKKWLRDKADEFRNELAESLSAIKRDISHYKTENDVKAELLQNKTDESLSVIKTLHSEIKALAKIITGLVNRTIKCPEGWAAFEKFCYLYFSTEKNYNSAQSECSLIDATVADIESQAENDFLLQMAKENGHVWKGANCVWIGITDKNVENNWISDRTGSKAKFINMRSGQPDGGTGQNCMVLGLGAPYDKWNDLECNYNENFICKKEF